MNQNKIVELVHQGFLEKWICVFTDRKFCGKWYAVDTHMGTIELKNETEDRFIIDIDSIATISYRGDDE